MTEIISEFSEDFESLHGRAYTELPYITCK